MNPISKILYKIQHFVLLQEERLKSAYVILEDVVHIHLILYQCKKIYFDKYIEMFPKLPRS